MEEIECTHALCIEGTRRWPAKYEVVQSGLRYEWVTYVCEKHMSDMAEVLDMKHDTVERLHGEDS